jgi:hypothetical protein
MLRTLRVALLVCALAGVLAPPANATRLVLPESMRTTHFEIHFIGDPLPPATPVNRQQIGELAANLERAYGLITGAWGFPAPLNDGDGRIDVYVTDLSLIEALGLAFPDTGANQTSGYIHIDDDATELPYLATHELFHLVQFGTWSQMEGWLAEATAEWAGFRSLDFPVAVRDSGGEEVPLTMTLGMPDMSVDCDGDGCGLDEYEDGGYSRWHFFQYLSERFDADLVRDVFDRIRAGGNPAIANVTYLDQALQSRGSSLSGAFVEWHVANMGGDYSAKGLRGISPPSYSKTLTGVETGLLPTQRITVNHLAARYVAFERGNGSADTTCYAATLNVSVGFPAGVTAEPYFWWPEEGSRPIPLAVSGNGASLSIPWDTCTWKDKRGLLSLPNSTLSTDGAIFTVDASLTVDKVTITSPSAPPVGPYTGPTIPAPEMDEPPAIALYGPEVLRVSAKKRVLRLVVFSSGVGRLDAKLGVSGLGTRLLRTGNNDLRFTIPKKMVRSLAGRGTALTLTSQSPSGTVGATLKRRVRLTK